MSRSYVATLAFFIFVPPGWLHPLLQENREGNMLEDPLERACECTFVQTDTLEAFSIYNTYLEAVSCSVRGVGVVGGPACTAGPWLLGLERSNVCITASATATDIACS